MPQRNPIAVFLLSFITFGLYAWYWLVKTNGELNAANTNQPRIPTAWIWLIPFVGSIWWQWKYAEGVDKHTKGSCSQVVTFILLFLLSVIGMAIVQTFLNKSYSKK